MKTSLELAVKVWDDSHGNRVEICEDGDGIGLVEIHADAVEDFAVCIDVADRNMAVFGRYLSINNIEVDE